MSFAALPVEGPELAQSGRDVLVLSLSASDPLAYAGHNSVLFRKAKWAQDHAATASNLECAG